MAATEIKVGRLERYALGTITAPTTAPSGPTDGFDCDGYQWALLRVQASTNVDYALEVYTYEASGGNDWIEDPSERQTPGTGEDYTRYFFVHGADRIYVRFSGVTTGNIKPFVTLS